ncbi:5'-3' exoribonuclease 1-like isoform X1 [Prorops nasuta]|uniref:5'-3' exoribonuclease 1-like isoform X1 n=1 Tax=Prorops nasuta TaxID=863751 RepID=UPI0034CFB6A1
MGVHGLFAFICQRYPCVCETVSECQIPKFDALYLDINELLYKCVEEFTVKDEDVFKNLFNSIELIFQLIQPQKLLFLAVDGVHPSAKINPHYTSMLMDEAEKMLLKSQCKFDSNNFKPGTLFMCKLTEQLKYFISYKISNDTEWQKCKIILSGSEVPGEGEHKIIEYIRFMKSEPDFNPNTRHCIYGHDADLIILCLCSQISNVSLLRRNRLSYENINSRIEALAGTKFCIVHLSLLKKYIEYEFSSLKKKINFFNIEKIIDDWVLIGFLVGNDFLTALPHLYNLREALPLLYNVYIEILPALGGYMNESGTLNLGRFEMFIKKLSDIEIQLLANSCNDSECSEDNITETNVDIIVLPSDLMKNNANSIAITLLQKLNIDKNMNSDENIDENEDDTDNESSFKRDIINAFRSQVENYIKTIQWNLSYYYKDCCSWSWHYPYSFSPFIFNIKNFKDLKYDFELGETTPHFLHLLKVTPSFSKHILPIAFQNIWKDEDEEKKQQYIKNISTTCLTYINSKKEDKWKAAASFSLSMISLKNVELLSIAIVEHYDKLTEEEKLRNNFGPLWIFTYSEDDLGVYPAPEYFPSVNNNHAKISVKYPEEIICPVEKLVLSQSPDVRAAEYLPGFPTLKFIEHTPRLENFEMVRTQPAMLQDIMTLNVVTKEDLLDLQTIASEILEKVVYVNWPYLTEAKVVAVSNSKVKLYTNDKNYESNDYQFCTAVVNKLMWNQDKENVTETYKNRWFINIGRTDILVHAHPLLGMRYIFDTQGLLRREMQWSKELMIYAYQMVLKNVPTPNDNIEHQRTVFDVFSPGCKCFMIDYPYYGSMVEVYDNEHYSTSGKVKISTTVIEEPNLNKSKFTQLHHKTQYMSSFKIGQCLGINGGLVSLITGIFWIANKDNDLRRYNLGLNLKRNRHNKEVHGYTKKLNGRWLYSEKVVEVIQNYMFEWPELFEKMANANYSDVCYKLDLPVEENAVRILDYMKKQKFYNSQALICGADSVEMETISEIEKELDDYVHRAPSLKKKIVLMQVEPNLLLKPELLSRNWPPDVNSYNYLLDRVICIRDCFTVPMALKGVIIAIEKEKIGRDNIYTVLFDTPFIGGLTFSGCAKNRCYRLSIFDFLNISHGERSKKEKVSVISFNNEDESTLIQKVVLDDI